MKFKMRILSVLGLIFVAACGAQSPKRSSPQQQLSTTNVLADREQFGTSPKLDVIFVVDNSISMKNHQVDLATNIPKFVDAFTSNSLIDFHIGVVTIWDSYPGHAEIVAAQHPLGQLVPLKIWDPHDSSPIATRKEIPYLINGVTPAPFVTKDTPDLVPVLASTILLGEDYGPSFEEMFSPVEAFIQPANLNGPNKGFYRPDAHLLIVFITDANDSTIEVSPEQLYGDLLDLKGGQKDKIHIYSILATDFQGRSCKQDQAGPPYKFQKLSAYADGTILSMCSNTFGSDLAQFGNTLSVKVGRQEIKLSRIPDFNQPITISYGSQIIPLAKAPDFNNGWSYDTTNQQIILGGQLKLKPEAGAKININFTPIDGDTLVRGAVQPIASIPLPTAAPATSANASTLSVKAAP